jgi:D-glycero-D-manno-heptose 1,7-bisphosphate phosphatase
MNKVVFLDRDGVINWDPIGDYIKRPEDFRFLPGAAGALKRLADSGFKILVVSNQAGVGDGVFSQEELTAVNKKFLQEAEKAGAKISGVFYCLHGKKAGCSCRKPQTGLFHQAAEVVGGFDKAHTYFVGDKVSDIEAGKKFGLKTIFALTGHGAQEQVKLKEIDPPNFIARDLSEAVEIILRQTKSA